MMTTPSDLTAWAMSIGYTVADVATLLFVAPIPAHLRPVFEDRIRQEVATELLRFDLADDEADRIENIAWLAFQRRVRAHALALRSNQTAGAPGLRFPS